ncbi:MAG TPA: DUF2804 family protein [Pyrinomonadaceae bacterium]|jgi:hypothetical protein
MSVSSETITLDQPLRGIGHEGRPAGLPLPPATMPLLHAGRMLKQWRFVGIWTEEMSVCAGRVKVGPVPQEFWAVWHRSERRFLERTRFLPGRVELPPRRMLVNDGDVSFDIALDENEGIEVTTPDGRAYTWTRKQIIPARGRVRLGAKEYHLDAHAFIDDNAGYHARRMSWRWSGGVGTDTEGRTVAWNLIVGLNDTPGKSENAIWINGEPRWVGTPRFAEDLSSVAFEEGATLHFQEEAVRARRDNLLVIRSDYAQPMGTFTGTMPFGIRLHEAYGVMERHSALW